MARCQGRQVVKDPAVSEEHRQRGALVALTIVVVVVAVSWRIARGSAAATATPLAESIKGSRKQATDLYNQGLALAEQGKVDAATAAYNEALPLVTGPRRLDVLNNLALLELGRNNIEEAASHWQQVGLSAPAVQCPR